MNDPRIFLFEGKRLTLHELVEQLAPRVTGRKAVLGQGVKHVH